MIAMQVDRRNKLTPWTHGGVESVCERESEKGGEWEGDGRKRAHERESVRV